MNHQKIKNIKNSGFKVPQNYFEDMEDFLLSEIKLKKTSATSGFAVPEKYFNTLEHRIISTVQDQKKFKIITLFSWRKVAYVGTIAASLIIMFNIFFNDSKKLTVETIKTASIENYIINEELEITDIASLFTDEDLSEVNFINDQFSPETLENYVLENLEIEDMITN